jgi:hypothetical protein
LWGFCGAQAAQIKAFLLSRTMRAVSTLDRFIVQSGSTAGVSAPWAIVH